MAVTGKRTIVRAQRPPPGGPRAIVLIDSTNRRKAEHSLYSKRCRELDRATKQSKTFEEEDSPAFTRWVEAEFAEEIRELFEARRAVNELTDVAETVIAYARSRGLTLRESYAAVKAAKAAGTEASLWGTSPDRANEPDDDESFQDFQQFFDDAMDDYIDDRPNAHKVSGDNSSSQEYLKATYRQLVRILHPDINQTAIPQQETLWHEVQTAYSQNDLQRLEKLLKTVQHGTTASVDFAAIPISHIMDLRRDVERRLRVLKRKLAAARNEPYWNFQVVRTDPRRLRALYHTIAEEFVMDFSRFKSERSRLQRQFAAWGKPRRSRQERNQYQGSSY